MKLPQIQFKPPRGQRKIRYASDAKVKEACDWVIKTYPEVLKKLAD